MRRDCSCVLVARGVGKWESGRVGVQRNKSTYPMSMEYPLKTLETLEIYPGSDAYPLAQSARFSPTGPTPGGQGTSPSVASLQTSN